MARRLKKQQHPRDALLIDIESFESGSQRPRKIAATLLRFMNVSYVGLERGGRSAKPGRAGRWTTGQGVDVTNIRGIKPFAGRTTAASFLNIPVYLWAVLRISAKSLTVPADVIFAENPVLLPTAVAHSLVYRSKVVFDARERPSAIRLKGSLSTLVARHDRGLFRLMRGRTNVVLAVCERHAQEYREHGFAPVLVVLNAPDSVGSPLPMPRTANLQIGVVGTLLPNRLILELVDATYAARRAGARVQLVLTGPASPSFRKRIQEKIDRGEPGVVELNEAVNAEDVATAYERLHVSMVLYDSSDRANDSLPNKLFESMAYGRCVVVNQPEARRIVDETHAGVTLEAESVGGLRDLIIDLSRDRRNVVLLGRNGIAAARAEYNWSTQIEPVIKWVRSAEGGDRDSCRTSLG